MRFGIFSVVDHYPAELPRTSAQFYGELLEQVEAAEALGFDSFWIAEHHFHEYGGIPSPPVWLAAAAQRTSRIRLGAAVVVLPFRNPLQVAEEYAMVDILSNGRLNLGTGSGYLTHEFDGFGVSPEDKRERFDEALDIVLEAWKGERFSYDGRYHTIRAVALNVRPLQRPRPPIWIAVLRNEAAAHVGKKGFPVMMIPYDGAHCGARRQRHRLPRLVRRGRRRPGGRDRPLRTPHVRGRQLRPRDGRSQGGHGPVRADAALRQAAALRASRPEEPDRLREPGGRRPHRAPVRAGRPHRLSRHHEFR